MFLLSRLEPFGKIYEALIARPLSGKGRGRKGGFEDMTGNGRILAVMCGVWMATTALIVCMPADVRAEDPPAFVEIWGGDGQGNGQFYRPYDIAIGPSGLVYVADTFNHRIQVFHPDGTYDFQWGSLGTGDGEFDYTRGIAIDSDGYVYVVDHYNNRIQKFAADGTYQT